MAECEHFGTSWGILASPRRVRLFQNSPPVGSAAARYLELDLKQLTSDGKPYIGLLAPGSLRRGGKLEEWVSECQSFGDVLREKIEERLRTEALPSFARGLG